jgi:hypothetical protein
MESTAFSLPFFVGVFLLVLPDIHFMYEDLKTPSKLLREHED